MSRASRNRTRRSTGSSSTRARSGTNWAGSLSGTWIEAWRLAGAGIPRPEVVSADQVERQRVPERLQLLVHVPAHDPLVGVAHKRASRRQLPVELAHEPGRERPLHRREALWTAKPQ